MSQPAIVLVHAFRDGKPSEALYLDGRLQVWANRLSPATVLRVVALAAARGRSVKRYEELQRALPADSTGLRLWPLQLSKLDPPAPRERSWCAACLDSPAGQRWLCPQRPHPLVDPQGRLVNEDGTPTQEA